MFRCPVHPWSSTQETLLVTVEASGICLQYSWAHSVGEYNRQVQEIHRTFKPFFPCVQASSASPWLLIPQTSFSNTLKLHIALPQNWTEGGKMRFIEFIEGPIVFLRQCPSDKVRKKDVPSWSFQHLSTKHLLFIDHVILNSFYFLLNYLKNKRPFYSLLSSK